MAKKAAVSITELIRAALLKVASAMEDVKLADKDAGAFTSASVTNKDAIAECLNAEKPLARGCADGRQGEVRGAHGSRFRAHRGRIAGGSDRSGREGNRERASTRCASRAHSGCAFVELPLRRRNSHQLKWLLPRRRLPNTKRGSRRLRNKKLSEEAAKKALERAIQLFEERRQNRLAALKREWEAEGANAADLTPHQPRPADKETNPKPRKPGPEPTTREEKDFRRSETDRLAAVWGATWNAKKDEARDYLESAMWNIIGLRIIGEAGRKRKGFDGRYQ